MNIKKINAVSEALVDLMAEEIGTAISDAEDRLQKRFDYLENKISELEDEKILDKFKLGRD